MKRKWMSAFAIVLMLVLVSAACAEAALEAPVVDLELADEEAVEVDAPLFSDKVISETEANSGESTADDDDSDEESDEGVVIDEDAFPDAAFRKYISKWFDADTDDWLSKEELEHATEIFVSDLGIKTLRGIDYFYNLEDLDCSDNMLTELDVSENTRLVELRCDNNELVRLDLDDNKSLRVLTCDDNKLTSLSVKKCIGLRVLYCSDNKISKLDVSKNTRLEGLSCANNKLVKLTIGKNKYIFALDCSGNSKLKQIDLGGCKALKEYPDCMLNSYEEDKSKFYGWLLGEDSYLLIDRNTKLYNGKKLLYKPGKPKSVAFKKKSLTLKKGKWSQLAVTMKPTGVASVCTFTSSRPKTVEVDEYGYVYARKKGTATITVRTANGKKAKIKVKVK